MEIKFKDAHKYVKNGRWMAVPKAGWIPARYEGQEIFCNTQQLFVKEREGILYRKFK